MERPTVHARSHRRLPIARGVTRGVTISRPVLRTSPAGRTRRSVPAAAVAEALTDCQPDPYLDYGRFLTAEGGVLFQYKDIDERFCHTLWRWAAWLTFTSVEGLWLDDAALSPSRWITLACVLAVGLLNWLIVRKPVEIYRQLEIRPDCLIIDRQEIFWLRFMEQWPTFRPDLKGNQILSGIYGTRCVEFLTVRRFDEFDRTPEIFPAHLQDAMTRLWTGLM